MGDDSAGTYPFFAAGCLIGDLLASAAAELNDPGEVAVQLLGHLDDMAVPDLDRLAYLLDVVRGLIDEAGGEADRYLRRFLNG